MARTRSWLCSSCVYWVPYPGLDGIGTCNHTSSRCYGRMTMSSAEPCECYVLSTIPAAVDQDKPGSVEPKGLPPEGTTCSDCHFWLPLISMPRVGQCENPSSPHFGRPIFSDKPPEGCFSVRSLEGVEFPWCQSHRQTIYFTELLDHRNCRVFIGSAKLPVADEAEMTLAGD